MDKEISSTVSSLLKTDKCSPLIVYIVLVVISGITLYNTNDQMKKLQNYKINNIFTMHAWYEIALLLILGVVLFGLCQYNKTSLAWIFLLFPVIYVIIQNLIVHIHVSSAIQSAPKEVEVQHMPQYAAQVIPQDPQHSQPPPMVPAMKQSPDMPVTTRSSQLMGGSSDFGGVSGGGGNYASYF